MKKQFRIVAFMGLFLLFGASLLGLLLVSIQGGYDIQTGTVLDQLSCHELFRPLAVCLLAVVGCCAVLRPADVKRMFSRCSWVSWVFVAGLLYVVWHTIPAPTDLHGDGKEYILQTQAIALEDSIQIVPETARVYWNKTNPYGDILTEVQSPSTQLNQKAQAGGGFGGLYPDRFGHYRYYHFWMYSLFVAPLYALFHLLLPGGTLEYQAFRIMNIVFLCLPFVLMWCRARNVPVLILSAFVCVTPLIGYTEWQHPELFCFCMVMLGFWAAGLKRHSWQAPIWLGIGASQNIPIALFFLPLIILHVMTQKPKGIKPLLGMLPAYGVGCLIALSLTFYNLHYFGVPNVITAVGLAEISQASLARVGHIFFSPMIGALWAFPVCFLAVPTAIRKRSVVFIVTVIVSVVAAAGLCAMTRNFNSSQIWSLRYTVWLLAPLWFIVLNGHWQLATIRFNPRSILFILEVALILGVVQLFWAWPMGEKDLRGYLGCERSGIGVNALYKLVQYPEDVEVLTENIRAQEIKHPDQFKGVYLWEVDSAYHVGVIAGHIDGDMIALFNTNPDECYLTYRWGTHPVLGSYSPVYIKGKLPAIPKSIPVTIRTNTMNRRIILR